MPDIIDKGREVQEMYATILCFRKLAELNPAKWSKQLVAFENDIMHYLQEYDNASAFVYALDKIVMRAIEINESKTGYQ